MNAQHGYVLSHFYSNQANSLSIKHNVSWILKRLEQNCSKSQKGRIKAWSTQIQVCVGWGVEWNSFYAIAHLMDNSYKGFRLIRMILVCQICHLSLVRVRLDLYITFNYLFIWLEEKYLPKKVSEMNLNFIFSSTCARRMKICWNRSKKYRFTLDSLVKFNNTRKH